MSRDAYRQKAYDAEFELRFIARQDIDSIDFYGSTLDLPRTRNFGDLEGVQRYVNAVCEMDVVRDKYPMNGRLAPTVVPRAGQAKAHYESYRNLIAVPEHRGSQSSWAMREIVVLHELAHYFTTFKDDSTGTHGTEFCLCFCFLMQHVLGGGWHILLMRAFDEKGIPLHVRCDA